MPRLKISTLLTLLFACALCASAAAKPPHRFSIIRHYGEALAKELQACTTCHLTDDEIAALPNDQVAGEQPWNAFGSRLRELGKQQAKAKGLPSPLVERLQQIVDEDADGDGLANELELIAGRQPGRSEAALADAALAAAQDKLKTFRASLPSYAWRPTQPVQRPAVPTATAWSRNPIDVFIAAEHARRGLQPRPEASKSALLRRVYLDLIGLPPSRDELQAFLADDSPDAYERVVDRLLASPQYGERWGRHWMDIWRYSDWAGWGEQVRDSQPSIWRWRDWIVESLNEDRGYDEMVVAMLAADEVTPQDADALRATGFLVRNYKRLSREQWLTDTVDHTSRAFLGATLKCAQCHDHMYDMLSQKEHYQFRAVFEPYQVRLDSIPGGELARVYDAEPAAATYLYKNGDERTPDKSQTMSPAAPRTLGGKEAKGDSIALPLESYYPALASAALERAIADAGKKVTSAQGDHKVVAAQAEFAALEVRIAAEQAKYIAKSSPEDQKSLAVAASLAERTAKLATADAEVKSLELSFASLTGEDDQAKKKRQELDKKLEAAKKARDAAAASLEKPSDAYSPLGTIYPQTSSGRRLALARWIASTQNPLAARVAANHIWARHFGRGIVATVDDFGQNGSPPSHPALLDWLAAELMDGRLSLRESSGVSFAVGEGAAFAERKATLQTPWSMKHLHRLIVTSSTYRMASTYDAASAATDPDSISLWRSSPRRMEAEVIRDSVLHVAGALDLLQGGSDLDHQQGLAIPRRSVYFRHAPEKQMPFLAMFDGAAPAECYERRESIVPQQALALANSELTIVQSRRLARILTRSVNENFTTTAYEHILTRAPTAAERKACEAFLVARAAQYRVSADKLGPTTADFTDYQKPSADPALRAQENLVHVLLNHHEFVTMP